MAAVDASGGGGGGRQVLTELGNIKELVRQLEVHLVGSPDLCRYLASQISSLAERSIGMIKSAGDGIKRSAADAGLDSSPLSDVADGPFKSAAAKKRKTSVETKRQQVRVSSPEAGETPVDDGHSWRKYGQKEILGAKHPRGYYRCTHRHSQGCQATKQVQRSDNDAALFDVIYHGTHTCVDRPPPPATQPPEHNAGARGLLQSPAANLTVKTEGLPEPTPRGSGVGTPFSFASTPASVCAPPEQSPFPATSSSENWGVSPATSDSNHAFAFAPFDAQSAEHQEVVSALVVASAPAPATDNLDVFHDFDGIDFDLSSLFAF